MYLFCFFYRTCSFFLYSFRCFFIFLENPCILDDDHRPANGTEIEHKKIKHGEIYTWPCAKGWRGTVHVKCDKGEVNTTGECTG